MKSQASKSAAAKAVQFELKRMEILRYHDAPISELRGNETNMWMILLLALLLAPTTFVRTDSKPEEE